jgi:putative endonuclease
MFTVYVLKDGEKIYKGMTADLEKRLKGHRWGNTRTTRPMKNFIVVYTKKFSESKEARKHEKYLKSAAGRRFLETLL